MVLFFDEEDLVSFGEFMVSDQRRAAYEKSPNIPAEEVGSRLKKVSEDDLSTWSHFRQQQQELYASKN